MVAFAFVAVVAFAFVVAGHTVVPVVAPYKVKAGNPTSVAGRVPSVADSTGQVLSYVKN